MYKFEIIKAETLDLGFYSFFLMRHYGDEMYRLTGHANEIEIYEFIKKQQMEEITIYEHD